MPLFSFTGELRDELLSLVDRVATAGDSSGTEYSQLLDFLDKIQTEFRNAYIKADIDEERDTEARSDAFSDLYDRAADCWGYHSYAEWANHVKTFDFTTIGLIDQLELL